MITEGPRSHTPAHSSHGIVAAHARTGSGTGWYGRFRHRPNHVFTDEIEPAVVVCDPDQAGTVSAHSFKVQRPAAIQRTSSAMAWGHGRCFRAQSCQTGRCCLSETAPAAASDAPLQDPRAARTACVSSPLKHGWQPTKHNACSPGRHTSLQNPVAWHITSRAAGAAIVATPQGSAGCAATARRGRHVSE